MRYKCKRQARPSRWDDELAALVAGFVLMFGIGIAAVQMMSPPVGPSVSDADFGRSRTQSGPPEPTSATFKSKGCELRSGLCTPPRKVTAPSTK